MSCASRKPFHKFADMSAAPSPYSRQTNFVSSATNNPNITVAQIATPLDAEYDAISNTLNQTVSRLGELQRDDGKLRSGIVFSQTLSTEVLNLLNIDGSNLRGLWASGTAYAVRDVVNYEGGSYICAVAHTSTGSFATQLDNGFWITLQARPSNNAVRASRFIGNGSQVNFLLTDNTELNATNVFIDGVYQQKDSYTVSGANVIFDTPPPNASVIEVAYGTIAELTGIAPLSVTGDKIANGAITTDKIADNSVAASKIAAGAVTTTQRATASVAATKTVAGLYAAIAPSGAGLQSVIDKTSATLTITTQIPVDNTIPQISEGTQILSASITPVSATNKIRGRVCVPCYTTGGTSALRNASAAVFRGSAVNAIAAKILAFAAINQYGFLTFDFEDSPGALTQQTYTVRVGDSDATAGNNLIVNGQHGGVQFATLVLEEIKS